MLKYEYRDNSSDKLIVIFQGALGGAYTQYPYGSEEFHAKVDSLRENLYWFKLQEKVDANYLFVKDTTNDLMGWYAFSNEKCIVDEFNTNLSEKINELGFERENVYTFGSSKGGTGALLYGVLCDMVGHVISIVPQIEIGNYIENGVKEEDRREYLQKSFERIDRDTLDNIMYSYIRNKKIDKPVYIFSGKNDGQYNQLLKIIDMVSGSGKVTIYDSIDYSLAHSKIITENAEGIYGFLLSLISENKPTIPAGFKMHSMREEKLGIICDINWYQMFVDYVDLVYITPDNAEFVMDKFDKVLYITPWQGVFGEYKMSNRMSIQNGLLRLLKESGKEIIFYSKEDPVNYEKFSGRATFADVIYTSSRTAIDYYRKDCKNDNINYMPYHINPKLYSPMYKSENFNDYHFAGSYISHTYEERKNDFDTIYTNVIDSNKRLFIRDRNKGRNLGESFEYPEKCRDFVHAALKYEELTKEQCEYQNHINMNSVKYDQDMCAVRIYELQAAGKTIHSNFSLSVSNKFPNINIVSTEFDFEGLENIPTFDMVESDSTGVRNIFSSDLTVEGFVDKIFGRSINVPKVLVVFENDREFIQSYKGFEIVSAAEIKTVDLKRFDYICFIGDENYSYYYIEDLLNGFKYSSTNVVSTSKERHFETVLCTPKSIHSMYRVTEGFELKNISEECEVTFISKTAILEIVVENVPEKPLLSIIIPIYNNGRYLRHRCLKSLKRLKNYKDYEILLVDDGSTDEETMAIVREENYKYSNVKVFSFNDGGSGSASRARNKGLEIATSKYTAYLDPDNELIGTGFEILLEEVMRNNLDFCFGKIQTLGDSVKLYPGQDLTEITNKQEFFEQLNFLSLSIQGAVFVTDFLRNKVMKNPEGLIGQDTLFCYDAICNGKKFMFINRPIHKYYNRVEGSVTNTISIRRLKNGLEIEKIKKELFEKHNLLEPYIENKNDNLIRFIYAERLKRLPLAQYAEGAEIICEIIDIYGFENVQDPFLRELYLNRSKEISIDSFIRMWAEPSQEELRLESARKRIEFLDARINHLTRVNRDNVKKVQNMRLKTRAKRQMKKIPFIKKILK